MSADQSWREAQQDLASMIHDEMCNDTPRCARGEGHQQCYRDRAAAIISRLEPEIGIANVRLTVSVIIDELWREAMATDTGTPDADYPDLDHPGYIRHCVFPCCKAEYHAILGAADGRHWYMGNSGPIHGSYICPDHIAIVRDHQPGWITDEEPVTGMRCKCGWEWTPQERSPAGVYLEAWKFHVRGQTTTTPPTR